MLTLFAIPRWMPLWKGKEQQNWSLNFEVRRSVLKTALKFDGTSPKTKCERRKTTKQVQRKHLKISIALVWDIKFEGECLDWCPLCSSLPRGSFLSRSFSAILFIHESLRLQDHHVALKVDEQIMYLNASLVDLPRFSRVFPACTWPLIKCEIKQCELWEQVHGNDKHLK